MEVDCEESNSCEKCNQEVDNYKIVKSKRKDIRRNCVDHREMIRYVASVVACLADTKTLYFVRFEC